MERQQVEMGLDEIVVKRGVRRELGDLGSLENSIRRLGVLCPVLVDRNGVLIAGERRLQACRNIGLAKVPALKLLDVTFNSMTALDIQADTNLCRKPLTPEELEAHIRNKKSMLAGKWWTFRGLLDAVKRLFSRRS